MVPIGVRLVDLKISLDEILSFGIEFLASTMMSKTPLLATSFTWKLIVVFVVGMMVGVFIGDLKSMFVDLKFGVDFRAKPPKEPPDQNIRKTRLLPMIVLGASFLLSLNQNGSAFDSQIRAHNIEIESYGILPDAFGSTDSLGIRFFCHAPKGVRHNHGLGHETSFQHNSIEVAQRFADSHKSSAEMDEDSQKSSVKSANTVSPIMKK